MIVQVKRYTVSEFEQFTELPENADRLFEFIGGEIVEVPSNPYVSKLAVVISGFLFMYLLKNNIGHITGEAGGYMVSGERYAPDVAFISYARQPQLAQSGYNPNPPELAIEVVSPTDDLRRFAIKLSNYIAAGTIVWAVYPQSREVEIHAPNQQVRIVGMDGVLEGGAILPGFSLAVKDIFTTAQPDDE